MDKVLIENFWVTGTNGDRSLKENELGWPQALKEDAQSDFSEYIFRYAIEIVGYNLLFY